MDLYAEPPRFGGESPGVLESTRRVVDESRLVRIDRAAVSRLADQLVDADCSPPAWDTDLHFVDPSPGGEYRTAQYVLVLDALNFCFWGEPRWQVEYRGEWINGYFALAVALKRAIQRGLPILEAGFLARMKQDDLAAVLAGRGEIPMVPERVANLNEVGRVLDRVWGGQFANAVQAANGSAVSLVLMLARELSSFDDVASWRGHAVRFYKRAQICAADLSASLDGKGLGRFSDLRDLTAFADYKVPQVLRRLGLIEYRADLAETLDSRVLIPGGSEAELEIRANTIWAVEEIRLALLAQGKAVSAIQIDWMLWERGQTPSAEDRPYHLTRTIYY